MCDLTRMCLQSTVYHNILGLAKTWLLHKDLSCLATTTFSGLNKLGKEEINALLTPLREAVMCVTFQFIKKQLSSGMTTHFAGASSILYERLC